MNKQYIFKNKFLKSLEARLSNNEALDLYSMNSFPFTEEDIFINADIKEPEILKLIPPDGAEKHSFENAKIIFDAYKNLTPFQASSPRFWTYLTHVTCWDYMKERWPIDEQPENKRGNYILEHWFVKNIGASDLSRNGLSVLWWGAYMTYDESRDDFYELTMEAFSQLDNTRTLLSGTQGRNKKFVHALMEYVIENKELFTSNKEAKLRLVMRKANYIAGYKNFPSLDKAEIKNIFNKYKDEISREKK